MQLAAKLYVISEKGVRGTRMVRASSIIMPCMVHGHGLRAPPRAKKFDFLLWPPYGIGQAIIFLSRGFFFYLLIFCLHFSSPILSRRRLDVCIYFHTWCGLSANLEIRSEMCCMRIAENTGRKKSQKIRAMSAQVIIIIIIIIIIMSTFV